MRGDAEDVLAALAGRPFVRLTNLDKRRVRRAAAETLQKRHAAEYLDLLDSEATRVLDRRQRGLW